VRRSVVIALVVSIVVVVAACAPTVSPPPTSTTTTTVVDPSPQTPVGDDQIHLNQVQEIGTHNSYHVAPDPFILTLLEDLAKAVPQVAGALGDPTQLNYTHGSIPDQLAAGNRTFELDTWADPTGNRFSNPKLNANAGFHDPQLDYAGLKQPGFKVFHIADVDQRSRCVTLTFCLDQMRDWSDAHPDHMPVFIDMELEQDGLPSPFVGSTVLPYNEQLLESLDSEISSALGDRVLTPDDVRGSAADLSTAVTTAGWPTLAATRGKFIFYIDNENTEGIPGLYLTGHPTLQGREMFTSDGEGRPDAAIIKDNDPDDIAHIQQLVGEGYIVRTRADADLVEPRANSTVHRDEAFASGAQILSSDYATNEADPDNGYVVTFGTRVAARCNPVNTTALTCAPLAVVEPN
jgi:hypothetical protein